MLIKENYKIQNVTNVKENIIINSVDIYNKKIFSERPELGDGIADVLFIYENDLEKYISNEQPILKIQKISSPFRDINEKSWTCKNEVNNNDGFLYMTNSNVQSVYDSDSVNSSSFVNLDIEYYFVKIIFHGYIWMLHRQLLKLKWQQIMELIYYIVL